MDSSSQVAYFKKKSILNDYKNMSLCFGFDDPRFYRTDGSNITFIKDRSVIDTAFTINGTVPFDASKKAIKQTASGWLTWLNTAFAKGNCLIVLAFRHKYDWHNWNGSLITVYPLYKDGSIYFAYTNSATYSDNMFNALVASATRGKSVTEIAGHTIIMWMTDGTTLYYYINNVLISSHTYTGSASDIRGLTGIMPFANNFPQSSELYLHEARVYNKTYTSDERTLLYNSIVSRFNLDVTNYPTASSLAISGTVSAGQTVTLNYTYNQNSAGLAGEFFVVSGWYYNASLMNYTAEYAFMNLIVTSSKKNDATAVVPSQPVGYYFYMLLFVYDQEGRNSKIMYRVSSQIV